MISLFRAYNNGAATAAVATAAVLQKRLCHAMRVRTPSAAFYVRTVANLASLWCSRTSNTRTRRRTPLLIGVFGIHLRVFLVGARLVEWVRRKGRMGSGGGEAACP